MLGTTTDAGNELFVVTISGIVSMKRTVVSAQFKKHLTESGLNDFTDVSTNPFAAGKGNY